MSSLPRYLINRFKLWKTISYAKNVNKFKKLAEFDQKPRAMIISCCDSRIQPTSIFQAKEGEFFVHRNIANLIPSYDSSSNDFSTFAAIEYAIKQLKVPDIIILGHTDCGGIKSGHTHYSKGPNKNYKFLNKWINNLRAANLNVPKKLSKRNQIQFLEEESIRISINNLFKFPKIKYLVKNNKLSIHGLIYDISSGELKTLNISSHKFEKI